MNSLLTQSLIFLGAALLLVPLAKKLGLSSILGYLIAGILIGPYVLGWVGDNGQDIMHAAEFGVVLMMFIIGLELDPGSFWDMRKAILGLGGIQVLITGAILFGLLMAFGFALEASIAVSAAFTMSSTAIALQMLKEKNLGKSVAGEGSFAVLLFQDIAFIPILAILPFFAPVQNETLNVHASAFADQPAWIQALGVIVGLAVLLLAGRYLVVPFLRYVSKAGMRELLVGSSLFLVIGVSALMEFLGLSPALGAFIAGLVLANSEFRHELESNIEPFKGLLLGLFFLSVGVTINFEEIMNNPLLILSLAMAVLIIKFGVLFGVGRIFRMSQDQNRVFSFGLSQIGEFGFVLLSFSQQLGLIDQVVSAQMMAVVAITMTATPFLMLFNDRLLEPYYGTKRTIEQPEPDPVDSFQKVIIAGFGHFGSTVGRLLRANGIEATILDNNSDRVELLRKMGFKVFFGDATRLEILEAAGLAEAQLVIAAIDSPEANKSMIQLIRESHPHVRILARSRNRFDAYELLDVGIKSIYRETLYSAVHMGVDALVALGFRRYTATRQGQKFLDFDERSLHRLASKRYDMNDYVIHMKDELEWQMQLLENDQQQHMDLLDKSWDGGYIKENLTSELK
ncbi:MAG: monovalent cation:proton antiporter-2 (CPA2) family protein [Spirosomataceae bacterium]